MQNENTYIFNSLSAEIHERFSLNILFMLSYQSWYVYEKLSGPIKIATFCIQWVNFLCFLLTYSSFSVDYFHWCHHQNRQDCRPFSFLSAVFWLLNFECFVSNSLFYFSIWIVWEFFPPSFFFVVLLYVACLALLIPKDFQPNLFYF